MVRFAASLAAALAASACAGSGMSGFTAEFDAETLTSVENIVDEVPLEEGLIDVELVETATGFALDVVMECPGARGGSADAHLVEAGARRGELFQVPSAHSDPQRGTRFEGRIRLPFWVPPGPNELAAACPQLEEGLLSLTPEPARFDLPEPEGSPWDTWRPTMPPRLDGATTSEWVIDPDGRLEIQVIEATVVSFVATCSREIEIGGARFVIWQRTLDGPVDVDDKFVAAEFPVSSEDYLETDDGIEIRAAIEIQPGDGSPPEGNSGDVILTAMCEATEPSFALAAEPAEEDAAVVLRIEPEAE